MYSASRSFTDITSNQRHKLFVRQPFQLPDQFFDQLFSFFFCQLYTNSIPA